MLNYMIEDNNLMEVFEYYGVTEQDVVFIKELIAGDWNGSQVSFYFKVTRN